jgi:hypothetical protein
VKEGQPSSECATPTADQDRRGPAQAVHVLLPVWGYRYVTQFLDFSLPTLLAPGNLPAVAGVLPSTFVFLTSSDDADRLLAHPGYRALKAICATEIEIIDDLITGDNHSTTITLAFERGVRATGAAVLDTCFFFLVSDYLMADGSLRNALARVLAGASGVQAGNFQIALEDAAPVFHQRFGQRDPALSIAARDLMGFALEHLHPMTIANTVNFPLSHAAHSNRLFWRVDGKTLIGRFYLMHMICIRPECTDFVVGASCDYSFIPEMCPSGRVELLTDSDEYLVVEMQPRGHERSLLRMGAVDPARLALTLSEWTTARHRENARSTLTFHAEDIPEAATAVTAEADRFVALVAARLSHTPQPHRGHPYWLGAIAAHRWALKRLQRNPRAAIAAAGAHSAWSVSRLIWELRVLIFGQPPFVRPWHPRWPDYRVLVEELKSMLSAAPGTLLIVGSNPVYLRGWLSQIASDTRVLQTRELMDLARETYLARRKRFRSAIVLIKESELGLCAKLIERVMPLLADDGLLLLSVINGHADASGDAFSGDFAYGSDQFLDIQSTIASNHLVPVTRSRAMALGWLIRLNNLVLGRPWLAPLLAAPVALLALASYAANLAAARRPLGAATAYSSAAIVFRARGWSRLPEFEPDELSAWARPAVETPFRRRAAAGDV